MSTDETSADLVRKLRARVQHNHVSADKWAVIPDPLCQAAADAIEKYERAWNAVLDKYEALLNQVGATDA